MPSQFSISRSVEFAETDMAGIMHFSNFFRWMEVCETAFYRSLRCPPPVFAPGKVTAWPRVTAACSYRAPLRFGDRVRVTLCVKEVRTRSIVYVFQFRKLVRGRPEKRPAARGEVAVVCATTDARGALIATPIPAKLRAQLQPAPAAAWAE